MKKTKLFLIILSLILSFQHPLVSPVFAFSTHPITTNISRTFDKNQAFLSESISITTTFTNTEPLDLRGFYYSDQIPQGLTINTVNVRINGNTIYDFIEEFGSVGDVYDGTVTYRCILETPNSLNENNIIGPDSTLEIVYSVGSDQLGIYNFDEFHWVGYYQEAAEGERASFGFSEDIDKQTVTFMNASPLANNDSATTSEDTQITIDILANDNDPDGTIDPLTILIFNGPTHGNININVDWTVTYAPDPDFTGTDNFTYTMQDNYGTLSNAAIVSIKVNSVNDAPVADSQSLSTGEDTPLSITLTGTDVEGAILTYAIVTPPSHGTLSGSAPNLTYTPDANHHGSDSFTFIVNDGIAYSNLATVSITINPIVEPQKECTVYEDAEDGNIDGWGIYDQDPSDAFISNVFDPNRQSRVIALTSVSREYIYVLQDIDWNKWNNSSQFMAEWSMQYSNYFIVYFDVHTTAGDKYLCYLPIDFDNFGSGVYVLHGLGSWITDGQWHSFKRDLQADLEAVQPGVSILEVNSFMVYGSGKVDDINLCGILNHDPNDKPANSLPIADNQSIITDEDTAIDIILTATDTDHDPLTYTVIAPASHGTLSGTAPNLIYTPNANHHGSDSFTFIVNDGISYSNLATVSITIALVNDPPVAHDQAFVADEDVVIQNILTATDADGDELIYTIVTNGSNGTAAITDPSNGAFTYTPDNDVCGTDTFSFKVNNGTEDSGIATVTIDIMPVNDAPVADSQSLSTGEDTPLSITLTGTDVEGAILTYAIVTPPSHGTLFKSDLQADS